MPSTIISKSLDRIIGDLGSCPHHGRGQMWCTAITVWVRLGDYLLTLKAIQMARPCDVQFFQRSGDQPRVLIVGMMRAIALMAGTLGILSMARFEIVQIGSMVYACLCFSVCVVAQGKRPAKLPSLRLKALK